MKPGVPAWSVVIVVTKGPHEFLVLTRNFNPRDPALPGGDSEDSDSAPAESARRELLEETGLVAQELRCIDRFEGDRGQPVFVFVATKWSGKPRIGNEGKPYWSSPLALMTKTATYRQEARSILQKLGRI